MSDLESFYDPEHVCNDLYMPYEPLEDRDLPAMDDSSRADFLHRLLEATREHAALLILALSRAGVDSVTIPPRSASLLLDLDEIRLEEVGSETAHTPTDIVTAAIKMGGENGYMGRAMRSLFALELLFMDE